MRVLTITHQKVERRSPVAAKAVGVNEALQVRDGRAQGGLQFLEGVALRPRSFRVEVGEEEGSDVLRIGCSEDVLPRDGGDQMEEREVDVGEICPGMNNSGGLFVSWDWKY